LSQLSLFRKRAIEGEKSEEKEVRKLRKPNLSLYVKMLKSA
jgi:hypothetical protein